MSRTRFLANKVSPLSQDSIWAVASSVRKDANAALNTNDPYMDVLSALEYLHNKEAILMHIVEFNEMPSEYAIALPKSREIIIREDTYENAINGVPRDRFTLAHELGHIVLHENAPQQYASAQSVISNHHYTEDAEWQANEFAASFLIDLENKPVLKTPLLISETFGVSPEVSGIVWRKLRSLGLV
ncbi:ImmA/IrrE family metallo-endopeptidase [Providencia stuartii]|uniref:ImmA/IrrE family metallo-endopeptidase n=1 Tax=Providencia stuartii TaxID=588 RepID=UPI0014953953|nr:ImmA/IrrE family metallo-endopeptidase [Providencia stuartii]NPD43830.1 ImmA/IrrE family metallo-endopeptidase [Providencia stuartii]NPD97131.1 ImmA/IrrE family metallo-endopeptidase [Providencia stuartii]